MLVRYRAVVFYKENYEFGEQACERNLSLHTILYFQVLYVFIYYLRKKKTNQTLKKCLVSEIKSEFMFAYRENCACRIRSLKKANC